jgi:hypothetical protein
MIKNAAKFTPKEDTIYIDTVITFKRTSAYQGESLWQPKTTGPRWEQITKFLSTDSVDAVTINYGIPANESALTA